MNHATQHVRRLGACLLTVIAATSCRMANDFQDATSPAAIALPSSYTDAGGTEALSDTWWDAFGEPELSRLIEHALTNNFSIKGAFERLVQAEASHVQRGAARIPDLTLEGSASRTRRGDPIPATGSDTQERASLGLGASYEVDLWGRVASQYNETEELTIAAEADLNTATLTMASEMTLRYLELMASRAGEDVIREQIHSNQQTLELIELRFRRSQASALDVFQQRSLLAQSEATLPPLLAREQRLLNQLAVLSGQSPSATFTVAGRALPKMPPLPDTGVPVDLLTSRPDIAAAAARVSAAGWGAAAAQADRLPAIRLTADAAYSSSDAIASLFDDWFAQLAAGLVGPIVDGGRRKAVVKQREAIARERLANYQATVIQAVADVANALQGETQQTDYLAALQRQLDAATQTQKQAGARYIKGSESYLAVLSALRTRQQVERTVIAARYDWLAYRLQLIRALGGHTPETSTITEEKAHE